MTDDVVLAIHTSLRSVAPEIDTATLDPAAILVETLDIDSIDYLSFLEELGRRVGVGFPEADYPRLRTVAQIAAYVAARAPGRALPSA